MSVEWSYFNKFDEIDKKYLPVRGEGDTMATQIVTAIAKLVYKWYNDGDVFDNVHSGLDGWWNDLSSYANWLAKYVDGADQILQKIRECSTHSDYEDLLKELCDTFETDEVMEEYNKKPKVGTIYKCDGDFEYSEEYDDDDWEDD